MHISQETNNVRPAICSVLSCPYEHNRLTKPEAEGRNQAISLTAIVNDVILDGSDREVHTLLSDKSYLPLCHYAALRFAAAVCSLPGCFRPFRTSFTLPGFTP
ncbi:hypothetical protein [Pseudaminobacter sp. NGMCC 1.201702]|uniref:hypothetical protein n=1 Tax=Pseudaminobacter sp. NGMCC 1.201702 TaxID=3391825 RepID=UPI0039EDEEB6